MKKLLTLIILLSIALTSCTNTPTNYKTFNDVIHTKDATKEVITDLMKTKVSRLKYFDINTHEDKKIGLLVFNFKIPIVFNKRLVAYQYVKLTVNIVDEKFRYNILSTYVRDSYGNSNFLSANNAAFIDKEEQKAITNIKNMMDEMSTRRMHDAWIVE